MNVATDEVQAVCSNASLANGAHGTAEHNLPLTMKALCVLELCKCYKNAACLHTLTFPSIERVALPPSDPQEISDELPEMHKWTLVDV